jgi:hypothetical protein
MNKLVAYEALLDRAGGVILLAIGLATAVAALNIAI